MAITSTQRDIRYPSPGDKVTITAVYTQGNRFRCRLINRPVDSALEVYTPAKDNYLTGNTITPDVVGCYVVEVVEESVANPVPRFSNDRGSGQCIETITPIASSTHYITVVGRVTRQIGFAPDDVTLECYATTDDFASIFLSPASGVLTRYTDAVRCPRLINPGSDRAKLAAAHASVARWVAEIGGYGNASALSGVASFKYGDRADQVLPIVAHDAVVDADVLDSFAWLINRMNDHIEEQAVRIHGAADAANVVTAADAVAGDEPSQRLLLNDIRATLAAHVAIGGGGAHANADSIAVPKLAALAPLPAGSTPQQRITRTVQLFDILDAHLTRVWISLAGTLVHDTTGDNHMSYSTLYPAFDDASVVAAANAMKVEYNLHRQRVVVLAALYHNIPGTSTSTYNDAMPTDRTGFVTAVRTALQVWQSHVSNIEHTSSADVAFHSDGVDPYPDFGSRTDVIPGPSDYTGALNAMEALTWCMSRHVALGVPTHGAQYPGRIAIRPYGIEAIHHAFRRAVTDTSMAVGGTENAAYARLIRGGAFEKA